MHPSASDQTESKLAARHIRFRFEPDLEIKRIRGADGNQVHPSKLRAPKDTVDRYAQQMKAGAVFPAIVVNDKLEVVDGNSRLVAAMRSKKETIAAYVCSDVSGLQAHSLSVELNQTHGLPMTEEEVRSFVRGAVEAGRKLDRKAYARITGVTARTLAVWMAAKRFEIRASRAGLTSEQISELPDSARAALNVARLEPVFIQATALALDTRIPIRELSRVITDANDASSEAQALAVVAQAREARSEQVETDPAGSKSAPRKSRAAAPHIGGLLRFEVDDLLDVAPDKRPETFTRMRLLLDLLDRTLKQACTTWNLEDAGATGNGDLSQRDFAL